LDAHVAWTLFSRISHRAETSPDVVSSYKSGLHVYVGQHNTHDSVPTAAVYFNSA